NTPVDRALDKGIPVLAFNADVSAGVPNHRLAYVGQNNLTAGAAVAEQVLKTGVKKGDLVAGIIATPGTGNIQPRIDGAKPVIQKHNLKGKVGGAGWDVGTPVVQGVKAGNLTFTIDQQAYLQGFDTIMQLFLFNVSGGLMKPTNTDTGLGIVVKSTVGPYLAK